MDHEKDLVSVRREWLSLLLLIELLVAIMTSQVAMGDEIGIPPTGLLCISNCVTCPAICPPPPAFSLSPPPPPLPSSLPPPPPPPLPSSPAPYYSHTPPQSYYFPPSSSSSPPPPPPHSSASYSSPPPSYSSLSSSPPPSYSVLLSPPPPPPSTYLNMPSTPLLPMNGPQNSSNPYYYFYDSKAASLSLPAFFPYFFTSLLCLSSVVPFW